MSKLPIIKTKELVRVLEKLGFFKYHQVGSHAQYAHRNGKRITVPIHHGRDFKKKILRGIINDLEITIEEFTSLLRK